jgi:gluconate 2-dehydrogenase gamma chain
MLTRRSLMQSGGLLAVALAAGVDLISCSADANSPPERARRPVLTEHERVVLEAATARLVPGPDDDPGEAGHPGAREAHAADYIVTLLGALRVDPPKVFAGGPFSDRGGSKRDDMAHFLPLNDAVKEHWRARLGDLVAAYRDGLGQLDALAGGDFAAASPADQDAALAKNPRVRHLPAGNTGFTDLLFQHTIEGCYSAPEYGGNAGGAMWQSIEFPGDVQPRGYEADQVTNSDGPDPVAGTGIVADLLQLITATAPGPPTPSTSRVPRSTPGGG